jgi:xylulokinase
MTGPLLRWVARHEPRTYQRARWALLPKDWIRHRLTGTAATDPSDASATLLWDLPADRWAEDVAADVGVEPELLPPVVGSGALAGTLRPDAARTLGLRAGIPVAAGAADTAAALLATGLADPAEVQLSVGTGGQIVRPVPRPAPASAPAPTTTGPPHPAGGTRWPRSRMPGSPSTGSEGRCRRAGRRSGPMPAGVGRAGPCGRPHRAAAGRRRGVAFALRHALEALPGPRPDRLRLAGGGSLDPRFRALLADVLHAELRPVEVRSASAIGATLLAAEAAGLPPPAIPLGTGEPIGPSARSAAYDEAFDRYLRHADALCRTITSSTLGAQ